MAHGLILSIEAKATEFAHLWKKAQISSNASSHFSRTFCNYTSWPEPELQPKSFARTSSLDGISIHVSVFHPHHFLLNTGSPIHKISLQEQLWKHRKQGHRHTFAELHKQRVVCLSSRPELKSFQNPLQVLQFWLFFF